MKVLMKLVHNFSHTYQTNHYSYGLEIFSLHYHFIRSPPNQKDFQIGLKLKEWQAIIKPSACRQQAGACLVS